MMTTLLEFKQAAQAFYMKYDVVITHIGRFLLALITLLTINQKLGYMAALTSLPIVLMAALLCSILPVNFTIVVAMLFVLGHLYTLSRECMLLMLVVFLLMFLVYMRFDAKDGIAVLLTPLFFVLHIPYVMPLALGLLGTPLSVVPAAFGVMLYFFLNYLSGNGAAMFSTAAVGDEEKTGEMVGKLKDVLFGLIGDKTMLTMMIAFAVTILVVYFLRRLSVDHAWTIAIVVGALTCLVSLMIGDLMFETQVSVIGAIFGCLVAALLMIVVEFFCFHLDYTRTEKVQFEDDDYYYYVKAVPKVTLSAAEHRVKKINRARRK